MYYGDNTEPGDINETAQFDIAAGLVWQWSGDQAFLHQNYAFIKAGLRYLTSLEPGGKNGPWPAGAGIVENTALGNEAVDVVVGDDVQALGVLHEMALAMGDHATAAWAARQQQAMLAAFHQWWISSQHLYADSLCESTEGDCTHAGQQLQQRWWTTVAPMEQGIAPAANADAALANMEGPTFTGTCGLYVDGVGGPSGTGGQTCYLVNTGAMARAEANYGRTAQAVAYMDKVASQLTVEMPGSLPELAASAQYNPFEPFTSRANVMQAWSSYGLAWTVVNDLLGVTPDVPQRTVAVVPEVPASWPSLSVSKLRVGSQDLAVSASHQARDLPHSGVRGGRADADHRHGPAQRGEAAVGHAQRPEGALQAGHHHARDRRGGVRDRTGRAGGPVRPDGRVGAVQGWWPSLAEAVRARGRRPGHHPGAAFAMAPAGLPAACSSQRLAQVGGG